MSLLDFFRGGRRSNHRSKPRASARRPMYRPRGESLETRTVLTSTLYIDFGDRFAGGVLSGAAVTQSNLMTVASGPPLIDATGAAYAAGTTFSLTSYNNTLAAAAAANRSTILSVLQRYFQPLDITVAELAGSGTLTVNGHSVQAAAGLADVGTTLAANAADVKNRDAYILVGKIAIGASNDDPRTFVTNGYSGLSNGADAAAGANTHDDSAVVLVEAGDSAFFTADTIAHEAGHLLGLGHAFRQDVAANPPTGTAVELLHESELLSGLSYPAFPLGFFTNFPTVKGDGNSDTQILQAQSGAKTPFEQLAADPQIGPGAVTYITGTGANDIITITKTGANAASVTVQAFFDTGYLTPIFVPGMLFATSYTFNIDLSKPLLVDGGAGHDRIVVDGTLGVDITARGGDGYGGGGMVTPIDSDILVVLGGGVASATYQASTTPASTLSKQVGGLDRRGTVFAGGTTIHFLEFDAGSRVDVQDVGSLSIETVAGLDDLSIDNYTPTSTIVQGTQQNGLVPLVPIVFLNIPNVTLNLGLADSVFSGDKVSVLNPPKALLLQNLTINTGAGNDTLTLSTPDLSLPVAGGAFTFNGGSDTLDKVSITGDANFTLTNTSLVSSAGGSLALSGVEVADLKGGASNNTFDVSGWTGSGSVDGVGGSGDRLAATKDANFTASDAALGTSDGMSLVLAGLEQIDLAGGNSPNTFIVTPSATAAFQVQGNLPTNAGPGVDVLCLGAGGGTGKKLTYAGPAVGSGTWTFTNRQTISFFGIELPKYFSVLAVGADAGKTSVPQVNVYDAETGELLNKAPILVFEKDYRYGVRVAVGDLNGDGAPEVVCVPGRLHTPQIKIIDVLSLSIVSTINDSQYGSRQDGFYVAVGDLSGNAAAGKLGFNDIVLSPGYGKVDVHVWTNMSPMAGGVPVFGFNGIKRIESTAFPSNFIGGATVAAADVTGDGFAEIILGGGAGMAPTVLVYNDKVAPVLLATYHPFEPSFVGGVYVSAADVNGDKTPDIAVGAGQGGGGRVQTLNGLTGAVLNTFTVFSDSGFQSQVHVAAINVNSSPLATIFVGQGQDGRTRKVKQLGTDFLPLDVSAFPGYFLG